MFNFLLPSRIYLLIEKLLKFINSVFFPILVIGLTFALAVSPPDYIQGDSVRIMYLHVPSAWIGLACFASMTILSIINFLFKTKNFFLITKSLAPIGLLFTSLAIITGSLWGKPTWGAFWVWDARLTSMFVLMFFYFILILSFKFIKDQDRLVKVSSLITILGSINLPIIKFSVDWWATLHQPASINLGKSSKIDPSMLYPLFLMLLVFR